MAVSTSTSSTMLLLILSMQLMTTDSVPAIIEGVTAVPAGAVGRPALMITWDEPSSVENITEYEIENRVTDTGATGLVATATETMYTIQALQPGTTYDIRVRAVATEGEGEWSAWISETTPDVLPPAPDGVSVQPIKTAGHLEITWNKPTANDGSTITAYVLQHRRTSPSSSSYTTVPIIGGDTTSHMLMGLDLGIAYSVKIASVNQLGTGPYRSEQSATTYGYSPVLSVSASPLDQPGEIQVSWTTPTPPTGSSITSYSIQYRVKESGGAYTPINGINSTATSHTIGGLTLGTEYEVRATAQTEIGATSSTYGQTESVTVYANSPAPSAPSVQPSTTAGHLEITWTEPTANDGSTITGYSLQYRRTSPSSSSYTTVQINGGDTTSHVLMSLDLGTGYSVRIASVNQLGTGPYGNEQTATTYGMPPAPSAPSVQPRTTARQLLVTWTRPTVNDGSTISGYSLQYRRTSDSSYSPDNTVQISGGNTASHVLMSLDLGTGYSVRIASVNQLGTGPYSSDQPATTYGYSPALSISASPLAQPGEIQVSWTTPTPPTGSSIISYSIQYRVSGSSGAYTTSNGIVSTATSHTISGLTLGTEYEVRATAQTEIGATSSTYGQTLVTTYNVPPQVQSLTIAVLKIEGTQGSKRLTITWTPPQSDQPIRSYDVSYRVLQPTVVWMGQFSPPSTQHMHSYEVAEGQDYEVRVRAVSVIGGGEYDTERTIAPDEPVITSRQYYETSITLAWIRSGADDFIIYYKKAQTDGTEYISMDSTEPIATITGLESNTHYKMIIGARNRFGSTNSSTVDTYTLAEAPGSTRAWALSPSSSQVTWTPPLNTESQPGRLYVDYRVSYAGISPYTTENRTTDTDTANLTITALHPYIKYTISVQAHNSAGHSAASSTTVWTYSDKPTMQPGERSYQTMSRLCSLTWKRPPPTDRNGIITNYLLQIEYPDGAIRNKPVGLSNPTFTHPEETTYNLTNLTPYATYKWRVAAATVNGTGPFSTSPLTFRTLEDAPGPVSSLSNIVRSISNAVTEWSPPTTPNGAITQYSVNVQEVEGSWTQQVNQTGLSYSVTDLRAYIPYNVTVTAHTSVGAGEPTSIILFTVEGVPQVPIEITTVEQRVESSILVEWKGLSLREAKGFPYYIITYTSQDSTTTATFTTNQSRLVITGLEADTGYLITVEAGTSVGLGPKTTRYFKTDSADDSSPVAIGAGVSVGILAMVAILVAVIIVVIWVAKRRKRQADIKQDNCKNHEAIYEEVDDTIAVGKAVDDIKMKKSEAYDEVHFNVYENITKM